ncbi:MAG: type II toxin-antitoxin system HicA family toxin [Sphingomonadaceae bacterium]
MPRLPVLSGAEVVRALERLGFEQKRQRGSHVVMRRGEAGCVVPLHEEVKRGTLAGSSAKRVSVMTSFSML